MASSGSEGVGEGKKMRRKRSISNVSDPDPVDSKESSVGAAMAKILGRKLETSMPVLAKRRTAAMKLADLHKKETKAATNLQAAKRAKRQKFLVKPSSSQVIVEKQLKRVATKGVVALFNAISKHQRTAAEVDEVEKRDKADAVKKLSKSSFLEMLKQQQGSQASSLKLGAGPVGRANLPVEEEEEADTESKAKSKWGVLSEGYMMGARPRDWRDDDEGGGGEGGGGVTDDDEDDDSGSEGGL